MPATQKSKRHARAAYYAYQEKRAVAHRHFCSGLMFWKACGRKKCLRARACVVDSRACFDRLWPIVPEKMKVGIRATVKAAEARLSRAETAAAIERDLARWRATTAPREVPQAAAEPAPQLPPIAPSAPNPRASSPRASGPRVRVL